MRVVVSSEFSEKCEIGDIELFTFGDKLVQVLWSLFRFSGLWNKIRVMLEHLEFSDWQLVEAMVEACHLSSSRAFLHHFQ